MGKRILVVDDDPDVRLFSQTVLEENGYIPILTTNGEEGEEAVKKEKPDLIILDVLMPRESGIRLYRKLKTNKKFKDIPIIMLSGIAEKSFLRSQKVLTEFGGDPVPEPEAYLEKPVDGDVLADTIKKVLG
jgi:two-component system, OmpR family, phosphate regulon response regulator PhoB